MDISTTIIGLLILALFVVPVIIISRAGKGKGKKFEKDFFSEVSRNDMKITDKDFWNEYAIGIDTSTNKIIYLDWSGHDRTSTIFDLKDVKVFETTPGQAERSRKNFNYKNIGRLALRFQFRESARPDVNITFYIAGFGQITDNEIALFNKWASLIRMKSDTKANDDVRHTA